ncbi:MAG: carboxypeptidase regulatory-like domain-containing protein [Bryobacteraceae bacterium]
MKPVTNHNAIWRLLGPSCFPFLFVFLMLPAAGLAQNLNASISGFVLDPSGAAVPGAKLTFTNTAIHASRTTATNSAGHFLLTGPQVGTYNVTVEAHGFKGWHQTGLTISVGENATLNVKLQLGAETQSVTVAANAAHVDTANAEIGAVIGHTQIASVAVNGRDYISLAALVPGARSRLPDSPYTGGGGTGGGSKINFNGLRYGTNNWMIDGAENLDTGSDSAPEAYPAMAAIQEFRVTTSNYSAAYPTAAGGIINVALKSGTNQFHGSAYEFLRNDAFDANNFFTNRAGKPVPPLKQNDFGFTVGGPIQRQKTFFFYSQEWRRFREGLTKNLHAPSPLELQGDFSQSPIAGNAKSLTLPPGVPAGCIGGLQIHPSCFNANAVTLLNAGVFPAANSTGNGFNNYVASPVEPINFAQELVRIDHRFSDSLHLFGHYIHEQFYRQLPTAEFGSDTFPTVHSDRHMPDYNLVVDLTKTFNPTFVNQFNFNISYDGIQIAPSGVYQRPSGLNIPELFPANPGNRIPSLFLSQGYGTYDVTDLPWHNFERNFDWEDFVTKVVGDHTFQFGGLYIYSQKDQITGGRSQGDFSFNGQFTGNSFADFLLGYPNTYTELSAQTVPSYRYNQVEAYFQDDWKVKPTLTLNLGVRWFFIPHTYTTQNLLSNFLPNTWNAAQAPTLDSTTGNINCTPNATTCNLMNGLHVAGTDGVPRGLTQTQYDDFAPRIGFAWDPFGHGTTSIRGGFGMSYYRVQGNDTYNVTNNPPFATNQTLAYGLTNTTPPLGNPAVGSVAPLAPSSLLVVNPYYPPPMIEQYSLSVQHQLSSSTTLSVAYVGTHGEHLPVSVDFNQPLPYSGFNFNPALNRKPAPPQNLYRPYIGWGAITEEEKAAVSDYNSLQVNFQRHMSKGLQIGAAYTFSKAMDDASAYSQQPQDAYNLRANWALSDFNTAQILQMNYDWQLPFLRGTKGVEGAVLGGWEFAGITTIETGLPLNIGLTGAGNGLATRPDLVGPVSAPHQVDQWFSTSSFADPAAGYFGSLGRNTITGPGQVVFNWSLYKHFRFGERVDTELRFEFYNVFNHTNFNGVSTSLGSGNFGEVTSAHDPRILQLGLMIHF